MISTLNSVFRKKVASRTPPECIQEIKEELRSINSGEAMPHDSGASVAEDAQSELSREEESFDGCMRSLLQFSGKINSAFQKTTATEASIKDNNQEIEVTKVTAREIISDMICDIETLDTSVSSIVEVNKRNNELRRVASDMWQNLVPDAQANLEHIKMCAEKNVNATRLKEELDSKNMDCLISGLKSLRDSIENFARNPYLIANDKKRSELLGTHSTVSPESAALFQKRRRTTNTHCLAEDVGGGASIQSIGKKLSQGGNDTGEEDMTESSLSYMENEDGESGEE